MRAARRLWAFCCAALCLLASPALAGYQTPVSCPQLPALTGPVTSSAGSCSDSIATGATLTDTINQEFVVSTAELDQSNTATLATITGLSITLTAGKTYSCHGHIALSTGSATAGAKIGLIGSSLTATSISRTIMLYAGTTLSANSTATSLDSTGGGTGAGAVITDAIIEAAIVVNGGGGGTLSVAGAQNTATSGGTNTAKFLINSTFRCVRVN